MTDQITHGDWILREQIDPAGNPFVVLERRSTKGDRQWVVSVDLALAVYASQGRSIMAYLDEASAPILAYQPPRNAGRAT